MKAAIWTQYGPPEGLVIRNIKKPTPKDNEVLIKIHATTVFTGDAEMRSLAFSFPLNILLRLFFGIRRPRNNRVLGQELAGEIIDVGKEVTDHQVGDHVFAALGIDMGAYAEYKCMAVSSEGVLHMKPANISMEEAASLPVGGLNALYFVNKSNIKKDQKVLINGAGGSIGVIAIQLAKNKGAEVTVVDRTDKLEVLQSLGTDHVIDYTREDYAKKDVKYDVVLDIVGINASNNSVVRNLSVVKKGGVLVLVNPRMRQVVLGKILARFQGKRVAAGTASYSKENLDKIKQLVEEETIRPVIDRNYSLDQIVDAHRYVDSGAKTGNVVIRVVEENH